MTTTTPDRRWSAWRTAVLPFVLVSVVAGICCVAIGPTLGLAMAVFAISAIASPVYANDGTIRNVLVRQVAIVVPLISACVWGTLAAPWPVPALVGIVLLLIAWIAAISLVTVVLSNVLPAFVASCVTTWLALAWLSWPIWTGDWVTEAWAARLISPHPLFVVNSITDSPPWPQHRVIYNLTRLGQDVSYAMPSSPWLAIAANIVVAVICALAVYAVHRRRAGR